jgi:hypothetical protein
MQYAKSCFEGIFFKVVSYRRLRPSEKIFLGTEGFAMRHDEVTDSGLINRA